MLDIPNDVIAEPLTVELEPSVEEKWEPKEETLEFDELFSKVEELSGDEPDEVQGDLDLEAVDSETVESLEDKGNDEAEKTESVSKIMSFLESSLINQALDQPDQEIDNESNSDEPVIPDSEVIIEQDPIETE